MSLFSSKKQGEIELILDIQSSAVFGTLVYFSESKPKVIYSCSSGIIWKRDATSSYLVKEALKALKETINTAVKHLHFCANAEGVPSRIDSIHFILSSPWVISRAKNLKLGFAKDQNVSKGSIQKVIDDERAKAAEQTIDESEIIEEKVFDVKINGYSVNSWEGKPARELSVSFVVSVAGRKLIKKFMDVAEHLVRRKKIHFHSSLLLHYVGLKAVLPQLQSYLLVKVHGELTDLAVIADNSCALFGSFKFGSNSIVRKVSRATKHDLHGADSLINLYCARHLDKDHGSSGFKNIDEISAGWAAELKKVCTTNGITDNFPQTIVLCTQAYESMFIDALKGLNPQSDIKASDICNNMDDQVVFNVGSRKHVSAELEISAIHNLRDN